MKNSNAQTHGHCLNGNTSRTYNSWRNMKARCSNPNMTQYSDWGGRGIKVCREWVDSFETFLLDMGECPGEEYSIDRIDNMDDYKPSNCKWSTREEQINNRRLSKSNKSGYKGINWHKATKKWMARKTINGKRVIVGYFATVEDAFAAWLKA